MKFALAITTLLALLMCGSAGPARAWENYAAWEVAHWEMVARWRRAEPRCGWTVGGQTCSRTRLKPRILVPCPNCVPPSWWW